jgi:hypothetical protein
MPAEAITIVTWLRFLVGSREAIFRVARCRQALWLGLVFVLSTGFAREYDGADLWHEPWHLVLPLVASLGTSLVLWSLVYMAAISRSLPELPFWASYRVLLAFYWMTAPLAWLYAIPVEQFMSASDATATNLWFLAAVSVWRVLLITRALSVWLNANFVVMLFLVMFFADSVAIVLAFLSPTPIFDVMGGIRLSTPDRIVLDMMLNVRILGALSWPAWGIAAVVALAVAKSPWSLAAEPSQSSRGTRPLWGLAAMLIVLGLALLPIGQPNRQRAYEAAKLLKANELDGAVAYMTQFTRDAFPPIWDPPPRVGYGEEKPVVTEVLAAIDRCDAKPWIRTFYIDKLTQDPRPAFWSAVPRDDAGTAEFEDVLTLYEKHVPADAFKRQQWEDLYDIAEDDRIGEALQKRLKAYLHTRQRVERRNESAGQ